MTWNRQSVTNATNNTKKPPRTYGQTLHIKACTRCKNFRLKKYRRCEKKKYTRYGARALA